MRVISYIMQQQKSWWAKRMRWTQPIADAHMQRRTGIMYMSEAATCMQNHSCQVMRRGMWQSCQDVFILICSLVCDQVGLFYGNAKIERKFNQNVYRRKETSQDLEILEYMYKGTGGSAGVISALKCALTSLTLV